MLPHLLFLLQVRVASLGVLPETSGLILLFKKFEMNSYD
jgi:hypothetical protein